jgi:GNAT superfamily N-acetyltransferase
MGPSTLPVLACAPEGGAPDPGEGLVARFAGPPDRPAQGKLYDLCFGKDDGARALPWRYDGCPHGSTVAPIALASDGQMQASYACSPRRVRYRGEDPGACMVGQTGDVMTHPELRSKGVFSALHWQAMEEARRRTWPAAWGLPNQNSGRIFFGKLDWQLAGHIGPWNFVLSTDLRAREVRLQNGRLAMLGTPWAAWRGAQRRARMRSRAAGLEVTVLERFPEEVAGVSEYVEPRFDWMVHRDAAYLNWRYIAAPSRAFRVFGVHDLGGHLVGYSVVQRPAPGQAVGIVSDLLGCDQAAESAALDAALAGLAGMGSVIVRAYGMQGSHWESVLARGGFRRPRGYKPVGAYTLDGAHPLGRTTLSTAGWYFTDGDRDTETVR